MISRSGVVISITNCYIIITIIIITRARSKMRALKSHRYVKIMNIHNG